MCIPLLVSVAEYVDVYPLLVSVAECVDVYPLTCLCS